MEAFRAHCQHPSRNIVASACFNTGEFRYEKIYERFVMKEFPGFFVHWQHFDNAKAFRNAMQELGIYLA